MSQPEVIAAGERGIRQPDQKIPFAEEKLQRLGKARQREERFRQEQDQLHAAPVGRTPLRHQLAREATAARGGVQ